MATARLEQWTSLKVLVPMSIGTDQGTWWGDEDFGSRLWVIRQSGKVDAETVSSVRDEIERCLAWLKTDGLASEIEVEAWQNGRNRIDYRVAVTRPDGNEEVVEGVWYGL